MSYEAYQREPGMNAGRVVADRNEPKEPIADGAWHPIAPGEVLRFNT